MFYLRKLALLTALTASQLVSIAQTAALSSPHGGNIRHDTHSNDSIIWVKSRSTPQEGLTHDFENLFTAINGDTYKVIFWPTGNLYQIEYDSATGRYYGLREPGLKRDVEVIGWYPYRADKTEKFLHYPLLSTIAFYSYELNPVDGGYTNEDAIDKWNTTAMIDSAKAHQCKVLLTITSYGSQNHKIFLRNNSAWISLTQNLRVLLRNRNADGVDLQFEDIPPSMTAAFVSFVAFLKMSLPDSALLTLQISIRDLQAYDFKALMPLINTFIVKGFDLGGRSDGKPASITTPTTESPTNEAIEDAVSYIINAGVSKESLVLALSMYDTLSLRRGFRWGREQELAGVGLWGLDAKESEIWDSIQDAFITAVDEIRPVGIDQGEMYNAALALIRYQKIIAAAAVIILGFLVLGALLACRDIGVRSAFIENLIWRRVFIAATVLSLCEMINLMSIAGYLKLLFCIAFLVVGVIIYFSITVFSKPKKA